MKLFLGGGGGGKDSIQLDKEFVASLDLNKPLLYIPIALGDERHTYPACYEWVSNTLNPLGVKNIVMWVEDDLKNKTEKDFDQFSGIYIGEGNTFKLLKEIKEFGTFEILKKLAEKDVPIYGGSAGAIILARTIIPAISADENTVGLTDFSALNLVQEYDVWCHYAEQENSTIKNYVEKYDLSKIIALPEDAGIIVTEDTIETVGPSDIRVFENSSIKVIKPGQNI